MELTSREIASLIWLGIALGFFSLKGAGRRALFGVVRAFCQPAIFTALALASLWIAACVALLSEFGLWHWENLKTTAVWAVTFAFVTMFDLNRIEKPNFIRLVLRDVFSATVVVAFVAELVTYTLPVEFFLILPGLFLLGALRAVAGAREELKPARTFFDVLAVLVVVALLSTAIWRIAREFQAYAQMGTALELAIPIILSLLFIPFIFAFSLFVAYQRVFTSLPFSIPAPELRAVARREAALSFRADLSGLQQWAMLIARERPTTRNALAETLSEIKAARVRESAPIAIAEEDGWSPYDAKAFLTEEGLPTNAYQDIGDGEWSCSATLLDIDPSFMPNRLGYYLLGDAYAAKRLRLKLYVNSPARAEDAELRFRAVAEALLTKAVGGLGAELLNEPLSNSANLSRGTNLHEVTFSRENWVGGVPGGYEIVLTVRLRGFEPAYD